MYLFKLWILAGLGTALLAVDYERRKHGKIDKKYIPLLVFMILMFPAAWAVIIYESERIRNILSIFFISIGNAFTKIGELFTKEI